MKQCLKVLMFCVSLLFLLTGCEKDDAAPSGVPKLNLSITSIAFESSMKSSSSFTLISTRDWTAVCPEPWVAISQNEGKASDKKMELTVYVTRNDGSERTAEITFTNNRVTKIISVTQAAGNK